MSASVARAYFAAQAVAGAVWWAAVLSSDDVRRWTLGDWPGIGGAFWHLLIRPAEEEDLAARFGQEYVAYRDAVCCWIPSRPRPRSAPTAAPRARS